MDSNRRLMEMLHNSLCASLLARIQDGTATAADLGVARQFLKDNGIDIAAVNSEPIRKLTTVLPFALGADEDDDDLD